jgi:hypothetical protein
MIYKFVILSDEVDNFRRDILIDSDATFYELHEAILDSVGYGKNEMTSFFICDEDWMKGTEITLVEMDTSSEEDSYVMDAVRLSDLLDEERQRLLYVFELLTERAFFLELKEIITGKNQKKPECVKSVGNPPSQTVNFDDFESKQQAPVSGLDEEFFGDEDIVNLVEYDAVDFGDLNEGNPCEGY